MAEEEEVMPRQKRRRTEGDVQSQLIFGIYRAAAPLSSTESTRPTPTFSTSSVDSRTELALLFSDSSSDAAVADPSTEMESGVGMNYAMTPVAFRMLFQTKASQFLLIDCRDSYSFNEKQINSARCVNVPIRGYDVDCSGGPLFTSKTAVIAFVQEHCPELLLHLHAPNHFTNIVIFDQLSSARACTKQLRLLFEAMLKWNETSKTSVHVLEGGFQSFEKEFPSLIVSSAEVSGSLDAEFGHTVSYADMITEDCPKEFIESLICYLKDLDESIDLNRGIINLRGRIKPLSAIRSVLLAELASEEGKLNKKLDDLIPDDLKCPICYEIFRGEIFQCENGHSICYECCKNLQRCPECRVFYRGRVRNRALENLLKNANGLKVECLCREQLELSQVPEHVSSCIKKLKGRELSKLEMEIEVTRSEIKEMNMRLGNVTKTISDTELLWGESCMLEEDQNNKLCSDTWKKFSGYMSAKKSTICSLNKALFSLVFCEGK